MKHDKTRINSEIELSNQRGLMKIWNTPRASERVEFKVTTQGNGSGIRPDLATLRVVKIYEPE